MLRIHKQTDCNVVMVQSKHSPNLDGQWHVFVNEFEEMFLKSSDVTPDGLTKSRKKHNKFTKLI